jgi:hypothetical protein
MPRCHSLRIGMQGDTLDYRVDYANYINKVLVPYVTQTRQQLELSMPFLCLMSSRLIHVTLSLKNYVIIICSRCSYQLDALGSCNPLTLGVATGRVFEQPLVCPGPVHRQCFRRPRKNSTLSTTVEEEKNFDRSEH